MVNNNLSQLQKYKNKKDKDLWDNYVPKLDIIKELYFFVYIYINIGQKD